MIYFLVSEDGKRCKIGSSDNVPRRFKDHKSSAPDLEFYAAIAGNKDQELQLQNHFRRLQYKDSQEHFYLKDELRDYLEWLGTRAYAACSLDDLGDCYPYPGRFPWVEHPTADYVQQSLIGFDQIVPGLRRPLTRSARVLATIRSDSDEWYTPPIYIEAAREVMGAIDLDPASCALANLTVRAEHIYTQVEDGLRFQWHGKVWLNPPYGNQKDKFVAYLIAEYAAGRVHQAVMCLNSHATDTLWFQQLWQYPVCLTHHRVRFLGGKNGSSTLEDGAPTTGTAFVYVGSNEAAFVEIFRRFGPIVRCIESAEITGEDFRRLQAAGADWGEAD